MSLLSFVRKLVERQCGVIILRQLPFGQNPIHDIFRLLPNYRFKLLIDVGAHAGETAISLKAILPDVVLHCIEPSKTSFELLISGVAPLDKVFCHQLALGDKCGEVSLYAETASSSRASVIKPSNSVDQAGMLEEKVRLATLDEFCSEIKITHISYLKIDTEGFDLNVLQGAQQMLSDELIDFVEVEVGMNPRNLCHVPYVTIQQFLEGYGFLMFGFYDQVHEWIAQKAFLRRCNALFIHRRVFDGTVVSGF